MWHGQDLEQTTVAKTSKLSKVREDQQSRVGEQKGDGQYYSSPTTRDIWRHEAEVDAAPNTRIPYRVMSYHNKEDAVSSDRFTFSG